MTIKVTLHTSFEFKPNELEGNTTEEKSEQAIKVARARLNNALKNNTIKALIEERVIIKN